MAGSSLHLRAVQTTVRPCQARPCAPFTSVRPHRSRCCAPVQAVAPPFNYTQLKQQTTSIGELRLLSTAAPVAVPFYLVTCSPAAAAEDTAFNAAAQSSGSTDLIVSVLAALVFGLLLVVTGGVSAIFCRWIILTESRWGCLDNAISQMQIKEAALILPV